LTDAPARTLAGLLARLSSRTRNIGWSFAGQVLPMLAGLIFVPLLIKSLGTARFGFLSLVWVLIGYFSLFDLGLARALTQRVANLLAQGDIARVRAAVHSGMLLIGGLALLSAPIVYFSHDLLLGELMHSGPALAGEANSAFTWLVVGVPIVIFSAGVRGILEGQHRFKAVNLIRTPGGVMMFVGPWLATLFTPTLGAVTLAILLVRLAQTIGFLALAGDLVWKRTDAAPNVFAIDRDEVRMLFGFGLWVTVSNVISPVMVYMDRFAISHFGNLSDVAYYSTPFDLIARLLFLSNSVSTVMFPALSAAYSTEPAAMKAISRQNFMIVGGLIAPITLVVLIFANPLMTLWVGAAFAARSSVILQLLSVGILINALASVGYSNLQAMRRADLTAKFHIGELPFYIVLLIVLVEQFGILGAAIAWLVRVSVDLCLLYYFSWRLRWRTTMKPVVVITHPVL